MDSVRPQDNEAAPSPEDREAREAAEAASIPEESSPHTADFYRGVVDLQTEFVVRWRPDGTRTFVNASYCRYLGRSLDELLGANVFAVMHEDHRRALLKRIALLTPESPVTVGQYKVMKPDGSMAWHEWTELGLFDASGKLLELQSVGRDIDKQKKVEEALEYSEARFYKAFHSSPVGIALTSMDDGRLLDVNEGFERIHGYSREEALGKTSLELGTWVNPMDRAQLLERLQSNEIISQVELQYRHKSGREGTCEVSIGGILEKDGKRTFVTVVQDITERKQAEEKLKQALEEVQSLRDRLEAENTYLRDEINQGPGTGFMLGDSPSYEATMRSIERVAPTDSTVLIVGESGTGKELVAREIHRRSARSAQQLIRVNCAAVPQSLYESEFFGHVQGAFTGAFKDRPGRFELADGGTLFLDEIAEIPLETQSKLLRVLQEREYERVGEDRTRTTDARIIAATNRNLQEEVAAGRFREDLYYRLSVFPIEVDPLRNRKTDIPVLAEHFIEGVCKRLNRPALELQESDLAALLQYDWPGNARELQNVLERSIITSDGTRLELELPHLAASSARVAARRIDEFFTDAEMKRRERDNIVAALRAAEGHVFGERGAAALLGIKPTTLTSRMKALHIDRHEAS